MSKLKVSAIHDPDNDNEALTIDSSGNVSFSGTVSGAMPDAIDVDASAPADSLAIDSSGDVSINGNISITDGNPSVVIKDSNSTIGQTGYVGNIKATDSADAEVWSIGRKFGSTALQISNEQSSSTIFETGGTERMRIHSNGDVVVGTYNNPATTNFVKASASGIIQSGRTGTGNQPQAEFFNGNGVVGSIYTNGSSTSYNTSSDYRIKENIVDMDGAIDRVKALQPRRFNWIVDESDTVVDGFIAHEVSDIVPEAISGEKDATETYTDDDGVEQTRDVYQGIDQSKLVPLLTGALQEAITKIETLETTVADLTTRIEALENA